MTRQMKDSGVEWIGEIPENWKLSKVKYLYKLQTGFTPSTNHHEYYSYDESGFDWVTIADLTNAHYIPTTTKAKISNTYVGEFKPRITPKGSLLYSFKLSVGAVAIADREVYTNEAIASFIPSPDVNLNFLYYSSSMIVENAHENIYGAKILNQDLIKNALILFPPLSEQKKIASFLDDKCNAIDEIIAKTEQSIEEYKKLKQSVITEAVTKGIRPNRKMKDSGIAWIGEIPADWNVKKFRHILKERTEKNIPIKSTERLSLSIDLGVTLYAEKTTNLDRFKDDFRQYKIAHAGDLVMNSMNMIIGAVGFSKYYGCVSPVYYTWYDKTQNHSTAKYCEYLLRCKTIKKVLFSLGRGIYAIERGDDKVNTCRLKISRDDLKNLKLPLPSLAEQGEIISYLDQKCAEIEDLIEKKQQFLTELATYKKSLIYEYVTGKKEVV